MRILFRTDRTHTFRGGTESDLHLDAERNTQMRIQNASGCGTREADALAKMDAHPDADKGRGCASHDPGEPVQASFKFIAVLSEMVVCVWSVDQTNSPC